MPGVPPSTGGLQKTSAAPPLFPTHSEPGSRKENPDPTSSASFRSFHWLGMPIHISYLIFYFVPFLLMLSQPRIPFLCALAI